MHTQPAMNDDTSFTPMDDVDFQDTEGDAYKADMAEEEATTEPKTELEAVRDMLDELMDVGDSLDDLLQESVGLAKGQAEAKAARERLKRGGQSLREKQEDALRIAAWEAQHDWDQKANVAMFHQFECECGSKTAVFQGLFVRETHKHLKVSQRWRAVKASDAALPNETCARVIQMPLCTDCAEEKGWNTDEATVWEGN